MKKRSQRKKSSPVRRLKQVLRKVFRRKPAPKKAAPVKSRPVASKKTPVAKRRPASIRQSPKKAPEPFKPLIRTSEAPATLSAKWRGGFVRTDSPTLCGEPAGQAGAASAAYEVTNGHRELPSRYGDNHIYVLIRDPYWLYTYWEIRPEIQEKALAALGGSWDRVRSVLRVYDTTDNKAKPSFFDITLAGMADDWYVEVQPNHCYVIEIGLLHRDGRFLALARSNEVTTPRAGMSDVIDENWMDIDFDKMYALSGGFQVGKSSMELKKLMEERLRSSVTSGSGGSGSGAFNPRKKDFWFHLDCELVVFGSTEPDANVTVQGKKIELRPDGTFSLRFALPDGRVVVDAAAKSADGREERTIIPIIDRKTRHPGSHRHSDSAESEAASHRQSRS